MAVAKNGTVVTQSAGGVTTLNTGANVTTTVANCLLTAFLGGVQSGTLMTSTSMSGGGLTWQKVGRSTGDIVPDATSEIWVAWAASTITNQTIAASWTNATFAYLAVQAWSGSQDYTSLVSGTDYGVGLGSSGSGGDSATSITTKKNNSWVISGSVIHDGTPLTPDANCANIANLNMGGAGAHSLDERSDGPLSAGTYSIGTTAGGGNFGFAAVAFEIIVASGGAPVAQWIGDMPLANPVIRTKLQCY